MKARTKQILLSFIAVFILSTVVFSSTIAPIIITYAEEQDKNEKFIKEETQKWFKEEVGGEGGILDGIGEINKQSESQPGGGQLHRSNTFAYLFSRLAQPRYIYNIQEAVLGEDVDTDAVIKGSDGYIACNPSEKKNLLNHNCNVPNLMTEMMQNSARAREKTGVDVNKSYAKTFLGSSFVSVPLNTGGNYTPFEIFGYDLPLSKYYGEWDYIQTSSAARMLSNFGILSSIKLTGKVIWNTVEASLEGFFSEFTFNPATWVPAIWKGFEAGTSAAFLTIIDTSDANVITTHAWTRPDFISTVYGPVEYLPADTVALLGKDAYQKTIEELFMKILEQDPRYKNFVAVSKLPSIPLVPQETEESITRRDKQHSEQLKVLNNIYNGRIKEDASTTIQVGSVTDKDRDYARRHNIEIPTISDPEFYTETQIVSRWINSNKDFMNLAKKAKVNIPNKDYGTVDEFVSEHKKAWQKRFNEIFDWDSPEVKDTMEEIKKKFFQKYKIYDPNTEVSRWVYAPKGKKHNLDYFKEPKNLFDNFNGQSGEEALTNYGQTVKLRQPIQGAYLGTGSLSKITDTRWTQRFAPQGSNPGIFKTLTEFINKITNTAVRIAFSSISDFKLIALYAEKSMTSFRDSIYFPLIALALALGALYYMFKLFKGSNRQIISGLLSMMLVVILSTMVLYNPAKLIGIVDTVPRLIGEAITMGLTSSDTEICKLPETSENYKERTLQCKIWESSIFQPWLQAQFGVTDYKLLDDDKMQNTNASLVGNADVKLGSKTYNNWALYQLRQTINGTISNEDKNDSYMSADIYRLVDLQAGPEDSGYDNRFFSSWSGENDRREIYVGSTISSFFLMLFIGGLSLYKLELTIMIFVYLIILPIVLLLNTLPFARNTTIPFISNLLWALARLSLVMAFLVLGVNIITAIQTGFTGNNFFLLSVIVSITSILLYSFWKSIISTLTNSDAAAMFESGAVVGKLASMTPPSVRNFARKFNPEIGARISGLAAGYAVAHKMSKESDKYEDFDKKRAYKSFMVSGMKSSTQRAKNRKYNAQRRKYGFGVFGTMKDIDKEMGFDYVNKLDREETNDSLVMHSVMNVRNSMLRDKAIQEYGMTDEEEIKQFISANQISERELANDKKLQKQLIKLTNDIEEGKEVNGDILEERIKGLARETLSKKYMLESNIGEDDNQQTENKIFGKRKDKGKTQAYVPQLKGLKESREAYEQAYNEFVGNVQALQEELLVNEQLFKMYNEAMEQGEEAVAKLVSNSINANLIGTQLRKTDEAYEDKKLQKLLNKDSGLNNEELSSIFGAGAIDNKNNINNIENTDKSEDINNLYNDYNDIKSETIKDIVKQKEVLNNEKENSDKKNSNENSQTKDKPINKRIDDFKFNKVENYKKQTIFDTLEDIVLESKVIKNSESAELIDKMLSARRDAEKNLRANMKARHEAGDDVTAKQVFDYSPYKNEAKEALSDNDRRRKNYIDSLSEKEKQRLLKNLKKREALNKKKSGR